MSAVERRGRRTIADSVNIIPGNYVLAVGDADMPAPRGWRWTKLTDVARLESGHTPSRKHEHYWNGDIPWIGIPDARQNHGRRIQVTDQQVTQAGIDNSAARVLPRGTVCLSRTASVGYVTIMDRPMATSQDFVNWICGPELDPEFLMYIFLAEKDALLGFGKGTTHTTIYFPEVQAFRVCIPSLDQQRRIVAKLDALRARSRKAKEALDAVPALLDRLRQSILASAFRGDLTADWRAQNPDVEPASELLKRIRIERRARWEGKSVPGGTRGKYDPGVGADGDDLGPLPATWAIATWGEVGFSQNGRAFPSAEYRTAGVRLLRPGNLHASGEVRWTDGNTKHMPEDWATRHPGHVVEAREIVMNLTAQSLKDEFLGRVCMTERGERCLLNQRIARLTPVLLDPRYVFWAFKSPSFRRHVDDLNTGSLIQHMFTSQINEFAMPVPPIAEQRAIAARLDQESTRWRALASATEDATEALPSLDAAILAKAFRGELVDRQSEAPPPVLSAAP